MLSSSEGALLGAIHYIYNRGVVDVAKTILRKNKVVTRIYVAIMYIGLPYGISISSYVFIVLSGDFRNRTSKILNCIEFSILAQFEICSFWAKER